MNALKVNELALRMGQILEGEDTREAGAAIGLLVGAFVAGFAGKEKLIREGVRAIASDAEHAAVSLYRARN